MSSGSPALPLHPLGGLPRWRAAIAPAMIGAALVLGHFPLLSKFYVDLGQREQYGFVPLMLFATVLVAVWRLLETPAAWLRRGSWRIAAPLMLLSFALSAAGAVLYARWLAGPAAWLMLAGVTWRLAGPQVSRALLPVGMLLLVIIPPPLQLDGRLIRWLQQLAVHGSSRVLDAIHQPHVLAETVIEIPGHRLLIDEACSGINSLMSVLAFTLLLGILKRRSAGVVVLLLTGAMVFVIGVNIARITLGAVAQARWNIDLLNGTAHALSGFILFCICLGLIFTADYFILLARRLTVHPQVLPAPAAAQVEGNSHREDHSQSGWPWWTVAVAFAGLGLFTAQRISGCWPVSRLPASVVVTPPKSVDQWQLIPSATVYREKTQSASRYTHRWIYRSGDMIAEVLLAYPFKGCHDPTGCYKGWTVDQRAEQADFVIQDMTRLTAARGHLLFASFDERGRWLAPAGRSPHRRTLAYRFRHPREFATLIPTHEVQTLLVSPDPLTAEQQRNVQSLFLTIRDDLARQTLAHLDAAAARTSDDNLLAGSSVQE